MSQKNSGQNQNDNEKVTSQDPSIIGRPTEFLNIIDEKIQKGLEKQKIEMLAEINENKTDSILVVGIFASIITFLMIESQFIRAFYSWQKIIGFSMIIWFLLITFNIAILMLLEHILEKKISIFTVRNCWIPLIIFVIGITFCFFGNEEKVREDKIYEKLFDGYDKKLDSFKKEYNEQNQLIELKINKLNEQLEQKDIAKHQ